MQNEFGVAWVSQYRSYQSLPEMLASGEYLALSLMGRPTLLLGDPLPQQLPALPAGSGPLSPSATVEASDLVEPEDSTQPQEKVENVRLFYFGGHGCPGQILINSHASQQDVVVPIEKIRWGDKSLRWVILDACQVLDEEVARTRWPSDFVGIRLLMGWHGTANLAPVRGQMFAWYLNQGETLRDAWVRACEESADVIPPWATMWPQSASVMNDDCWTEQQAAPGPRGPLTQFAYVRCGDTDKLPGYSDGELERVEIPPELPAPPAPFPWSASLSDDSLCDLATKYAASLGWIATEGRVFHVLDVLGLRAHRIRLKISLLRERKTSTLDIFPDTGALRWSRAGWSPAGPTPRLPSRGWGAGHTTLELANVGQRFISQHAILREVSAEPLFPTCATVTQSKTFNDLQGRRKSPVLLLRHLLYSWPQDIVGPGSRLVLSLDARCSVVNCYRAVHATPREEQPPTISAERAAEIVEAHLSRTVSPSHLPSGLSAPRLAWYAGSPGYRQPFQPRVYVFEADVPLPSGAVQRRSWYVLAREMSGTTIEKFSPQIMSSLLTARDAHGGSA